MHTHTDTVTDTTQSPLLLFLRPPLPPALPAGSGSGLCRCLFRSFARWLVRCGPLLLRLSVGSLERDTRAVARAIAIQAKCFKLVEIHAALHPISFSGLHMQFMVLTIDQ